MCVVAGECDVISKIHIHVIQIFTFSHVMTHRRWHGLSR